MAKVGGMHSQTNMVLYIIVGIILVGMIFFGVGFKVGNSSVERFETLTRGPELSKNELNALMYQWRRQDNKEARKTARYVEAKKAAAVAKSRG